MHYSLTQAGNLVKLVSAFLVLFGAAPFSTEEANAIVVVIGLAGEGIGFIMSWIGRYRGGGLTIIGTRS